MGDTEAAIRSEEAATRTLVVMGAGALTVATGGAGAPILAGALAAVAAGAVYDGITTGIESARHHTYDPQGVFGAGTELVEEIHEGKDIRDGVFDTVSIVVGDALMGRTEGLGMTTKVFRVEGESFWKENGTYETRTSQRLFVIDGDIHATDAPSTAFVGPGQEDGNMLFLNFGEEARAHSYYAQRVLQYKDSVEAHTENLRRTEGGDIHPAVAPHNIRIKSFRILTRDAKDVQSRSVPEKWSRWNEANVGIIEVDPTKAPNQYGCTRPQYSPILQNALKGSYKDGTPWFRHLPPRVYELIHKNPIAYGRVRMIILDSKTVVVQALRAEIAQNIKDERDEKTVRSSFVPLAYVKDDYVEKLDTLDVAIPGLRQCRHVKCGRKSSRDPNHGQHYEYLVDFGNNTTRWYPEELISDDLKEEYRQLTLSHAKHVSKVVDTSGDNLVVTHSDGSTETVPKTLMFWLEEPQEDTQMTVKEFDTILHHAHHGNDIATVGGAIAIRNMNGKYMKVTKTNGLEFNSTEFDDAAIFFVIPRSNDKIGLVGEFPSRW
ncbi:hypothetical protein M378DRAFT_821117 [Amanita muscaria Koide BX008]|uniref:Uncharacterized protein n=1 Tax=Amanita muscaria (strain Koide BX008) TaxID=946122 RepID=A0A0C2WJN8_AMAMK|nr:hypothetical protein M378DRAFT_821117 [Amanita muscaria Koide BX008]